MRRQYVLSAAQANELRVLVIQAGVEAWSIDGLVSTQLGVRSDDRFATLIAPHAHAVARMLAAISARLAEEGDDAPDA